MLSVIEIFLHHCKQSYGLSFVTYSATKELFTVLPDGFELQIRVIYQSSIVSLVLIGQGESVRFQEINLTELTMQRVQKFITDD